ncbi:hypothetical protein HanPSC8_Chr08g0321681 [Helianthus annuus]|nr:hypothetical protein HanPSC8_Chr08g0321681 [Helianthus annuus]
MWWSAYLIELDILLSIRVEPAINGGSKGATPPWLGSRVAPLGAGSNGWQPLVRVELKSLMLRTCHII